MIEDEQLFCSKPFKWFEVFQGGEVYLCCPGWLDTPAGHLSNNSVEEIWNGEKAQEIRRSILDGSFRHCLRSRCPYLQTMTGPVQKIGDIEDPELKTVVEKTISVLPYGPRALNCSYDRSCNLFCPSCRHEVIVEKNAEQQILEIQHKLQKDAFKNAHLLYFAGTGDPFGSPSYRKVLQTMKRENVPNLERIFLHTNAQLWTPKMWSTIPSEIQKLVKSTEISIDAASSETYLINRRGGNFERLLENLEFVRTLRQKGPLEWVTISMVVQENNFQEMPQFVQLGKRFRVDRVFFSQLINWGTFSEEEFDRRAIHFPAHYRYGDFIHLLKSDVFHDPIVHLGNLMDQQQLNHL
jgi:hypothetical protein